MTDFRWIERGDVRWRVSHYPARERSIFDTYRVRRRLNFPGIVLAVPFYKLTSGERPAGVFSLLREEPLSADPAQDVIAIHGPGASWGGPGLVCMGPMRDAIHQDGVSPENAYWLSSFVRRGSHAYYERKEITMTLDKFCTRQRADNAKLQTHFGIW